MRKYIFSRSEKRRLLEWLDGNLEDQETRKVFVSIRRNLSSMQEEVEILSRAAHRLSAEGRLLGRVRLKKRPAEESQDGKA